MSLETKLVSLESEREKDLIEAGDNNLKTESEAVNRIDVDDLKDDLKKRENAPVQGDDNDNLSEPLHNDANDNLIDANHEEEDVNADLDALLDATVKLEQDLETRESADCSQSLYKKVDLYRANYMM